MNEKRVLLVEDNASAGVFLEQLLEDKGFEVTHAFNGKEAVDHFQENPFNVVITDLRMPEMTGNELIEKLRKFPDPPVFIVLTAYKDPDLIIDTMKLNVFDYMIKPVNFNKLHMRLNKAFEFYEMKKNIKITEKERIIRMEEQLEWFKYLDKMKNANNLNSAEPLFHNLHVNFNQGAGFGTLVRIIDILAASAEKQDDKYIIDADLFDVVVKNSEIAEKSIEIFSNIEMIVNKDITPERITYDDLYKCLKKITDEVNQFGKERNQTILIGERGKENTNISLSLSMEFIEKAYFEILNNALKFSENNSEIFVLTDVANDKFILSVINSPAVDEKGRRGIPGEYRNLVFEPFFRLTKRMPEPHETPNLGLGLTMVDKIISRLGGQVSISNVTDYSNIKRNPVKKVNLSISLPVNEAH